MCSESYCIDLRSKVQFLSTCCKYVQCGDTVMCFLLYIGYYYTSVNTLL